MPYLNNGSQFQNALKHHMVQIVILKNRQKTVMGMAYGKGLVLIKIGHQI